VGFLKPVRDYIDGLIHPSAQHDVLAAARHRAFIAPRLLGSFLALAAFPAYLALRGVPSLLEVIVFAWLVTPIVTAYFLSRTGAYESAHVLSSLSLTGLVTVVAYNTGGIVSFAAIWLVVVPLEAALSASRRVVATASTFALGAAGFLLLMRMADLIPPVAVNEQGALAALGVISAALYATGLALSAESLARTSVWLLYAEEDRYRLLARNMTDVITRHGRQGAVQFVSPAAESVFGVRVGDLLGHGLFDRVHVADRPAYLTALADAAASGQARAVEFRVRREPAGGSPAASHFIWIDMRCRPVGQATGESHVAERDVVAVLRDVTGRKAQEQALEEARSVSERANAAKTRFLATMSHELRTPLNAIIGFSEMLAKEGPLQLSSERRQDYAQLINDSGHHLLAVVNGILDMSKIETGDFEIMPEPFAANEVISKCCDILALKAREAGVELRLQLDDHLPEIVADKRALKQIMLNLLSNAIKFTDRGGCVSVGARAQGVRLSITVEDTGVGISEGDLVRIGDPFFQARSTYDRRHDGTGLGLSIVKGLLSLHGGEFDMRSALGKGTRVTVRLPLDCEAGKMVRPQTKSAQPTVAAQQPPAEVTVRKSA
jgi:cell cycle sensor histidine kinase DivJ